MSCVQINRVKINYQSLGNDTAPLMLFVHGWRKSWQAWEDAMRLLSSRYRCYALDLIGHGESEKPDCRHTISQFVELGKDFCHELNITRAIVMGHSMGGQIALALTLEYADLVDRLILVAPVVTGRLSPSAERLVPIPVMLLLSIPRVGQALPKICRQQRVLQRGTSLWMEFLM